METEISTNQTVSLTLSLERHSSNKSMTMWQFSCLKIAKKICPNDRNLRKLVVSVGFNCSHFSEMHFNCRLWSPALFGNCCHTFVLYRFRLHLLLKPWKYGQIERNPLFYPVITIVVIIIIIQTVFLLPWG